MKQYKLPLACVACLVSGFLFGYIINTGVPASAAPYLVDVAEAQIQVQAPMAIPLEPPTEPGVSYIPPIVYPTVVEMPGYVVTVQDGYIVVEYQSKGTLHLETNISIHSMPIEEQDRLMAGIVASNEDELFRILEDYGS